MPSSPASTLKLELYNSLFNGLEHQYRSLAFEQKQDIGLGEAVKKELQGVLEDYVGTEKRKKKLSNDSALSGEGGLKRIELSNFDSLSPESQKGVLAAIAEFAVSMDKVYLLSYGFRIEPAKEQTVDALPTAAKHAWLALSPAREGNPFHPIIQQWLKNHRNGLALHYELPIELQAQCRVSSRNPSYYYQQLMGTAFFSELLEYFASLPRDPVSREALGFRSFKYNPEWKTYTDFPSDLQLLVKTPYFPLDLELPHFDYSENPDAFESLLQLIRTAQAKGIHRIYLSEYGHDSSRGSFSVKQLTQLLALVRGYNEQELAVCQLEGVSLVSSAYDGRKRQEWESLVNQVKAACEKNFKIINKKRVLSLLDKGVQALVIGARARELESKDQEEEKRDEEVKEEAGAKARVKPKRSLSDLISLATGRSAQLHVQQEEQQQQQQQQEQEQQKEQRQDLNQGLQAMDSRDIIDYQKWPELKQSLLKLTPLQRKVLEKEPGADAEAWLAWTLQGLGLSHSLYGFTRPALEEIIKHITLFRDGFSFEHFSQGFVVRQAEINGKMQRILCYDPGLATPADPLAVKLTQPAVVTMRSTKWKLFDGNPNEKDLDALMGARNSYCVTDIQRERGTHRGLCACPGCALEKHSKDLSTEVEQFLGCTNDQLVQALKIEAEGLQGKRSRIKRDAGYKSGLYMGPYAYKGEPTLEILLEDSDRHSVRWGWEIGLDSLRYVLKDVKLKYISQLWKSVLDLELPEKIVSYGCDRSSVEIKGFGQEIYDHQIRSRIAQLDFNTLAEQIWAEWRSVISNYQKNLNNQRAAVYQLFWGGDSSEQIEQAFPILQRLSMRHLRLLVEIAIKLDIEDFGRNNHRPQVIEALLRKLGQIAALDGSSRTFDILFATVLQPSDSWLSSLFSEDNQLIALNNICQLGAQDRANWNYLLERHGASCGHVDLHHAWAAFQHFNQEYAALTGGLPPLDFTQFPPESTKNMFLFLDFLKTILVNASDKQEQVDLLARGKISIDQTGAYLAMRFQGYYRVSQEMGLGLSAEQKAALQPDQAGGGLEKPLDYRVTRAELIQNPNLVSFYRYLGQQAQASLPFSFYKQCVAEVGAPPEGLLDPKLTLLAITSANDHAADLQEGNLSRFLWQYLVQQQNPEERNTVNLLLEWHRPEAFPALSFVEAVVLLHCWEQVENQEQKCLLILETKKLIDNPFYREAFLGVLHQVYAPQLAAKQPNTLLPLENYLLLVNQLTRVFEAEDPVLDKQRAKKLFLFVSRIQPVPSLDSIDDLIATCRDYLQGLEEEKIELSPVALAAIDQVLEKFKASIKGEQKEQVQGILGALWKGEGELEQVNAALTRQAEAFLTVLLDPSAIWSRRRDDLIKLIAGLPNLSGYNFIFLANLLKALKPLSIIDSELTVFNILLQGDWSRHLDLQAPFCQAVTKICQSSAPSKTQNERMLRILHRYTQQYYTSDLSLENLSSALIYFAENCPAAADNILLILDHVLKSDSPDKLNIKEILDNLQELVKPEKINPKILKKLLHNVAGNKDTKSSFCPEVLKYCSHRASLPFIEILANCLGRKDNQENLQDFLDLLSHLEKLESKQPDPNPFALLYTLSTHPPKLGIKKLLGILKPEGQILESEELVNRLRILEIDPHYYDLDKKENPSLGPFDEAR